MVCPLCREELITEDVIETVNEEKQTAADLVGNHGVISTFGDM